MTGRMIAAFFCTGLSVGASSGCSTDDGFQDLLAQGCSSKADCARLVNDAKYRLKYCRDGVFGHVGCDQARADLRAARKVSDSHEVTAAPALARE